MDVVVQLVLGAVIGAVSSIGISWYFFKKQTEDLESKAFRLERLITLFARYLEHEGIIKGLEFDERGFSRGGPKTSKPLPSKPLPFLQGTPSGKGSSRKRMLDRQIQRTSNLRVF